MSSKIVHIENIQHKIFTIRGNQVMLDSDLAELYGVSTGRLNEQVKRNLNRFPTDFMFQLSDNEWKDLISQNATSSWGGRRKFPNVFTEQGIASLSGVLTSDIAINVNISIMRAFVQLRKFILTNASVFHKINMLETKQIETDKKLDKVFKALESKNTIPKQGIFFDGQIFDAYKFVSDIIRTAKKSIVLIDNYVDDTVLTLFSKKSIGVKCIILTKTISKQLKLDIAKYRMQYSELSVKEFERAHDRFLIIDNEVVYHFGASLKDLGKKWFAFSKMDKNSVTILQTLKDVIK